jgi:hypothetical protein
LVLLSSYQANAAIARAAVQLRPIIFLPVLFSYARERPREHGREIQASPNARMAVPRATRSANMARATGSKLANGFTSVKVEAWSG